MSKPLKRNPNLIPLSREHHFGLLFCWKTRQGIKLHVPPARIGKYILFYWDKFLEQHFKEEETLLFLDKKDSLVVKALSDHDEIRNLVGIIRQGEIDNEFLENLASSMENHIRYEERLLFPYLEKSLPPAQLELIGTHLDAGVAEKLVDDYEDEFWIRKKSQQH